jgi:septal ring factor EnvC (AmiA/AmiB activator)
MTDDVDTVQSSELERLVAALPDNRKCVDRYSMKREGCPECNADDGAARARARRSLERNAESLAGEVLVLREQNAQARKALEAWAEWELTLEGADYQITPPTGLADVKKLGRKALAAMKGGSDG